MPALSCAHAAARPAPFAGKMAAALGKARHPNVSALVRMLLLSAVADREGWATATGVRHWLKYTVYGVGLPPVQHLERDASKAEKLEAEVRLMNCVVWLVMCAGRPGETSRWNRCASTCLR